MACTNSAPVARFDLRLRPCYIRPKHVPARYRSDGCAFAPFDRPWMRGNLTHEGPKPTMGQLIIIEKWAENLDEATISRWLKQEGDRVEPGDSLCEIITDKATFEYEIEEPGIVLAIYAPPKSTVPVGYVIAFTGEPSEQPPQGIEEQNSALMAEHRAQSDLDLDLDIALPQGLGGSAVRSSQPRARPTPAARRLARQHDLKIEDIAEALDIHGVVGERDVERYLRGQTSDDRPPTSD